MSTLTADMLANLKAEINNDPKGRGYSGKTTAEAADLINATYIVPGPVMTMPARVGQILTQPAAPNIVTADDVTTALNS